MSPLISDTDSVLMVIDVQPVFLERVGGVWAEETLDRIAWLVKAALALEIPVVVTEEEPAESGITPTEITAQLPDSSVRHRKLAYGLAACPEILADAERHGRRTAVLCGMETDVCVAQSAIGLKDAGWRVVVVEDAVATPGDAQHQQGLARMRDAGIELVGTKQLAYEWLRTIPRAREMWERLMADPPKGIVL